MTGARGMLARAAPRVWWAARSARERLLLALLAVALAAYALLAGAVQPLLAAREEARAAIARHDAALARLAALPATAAPAAVADARPVGAIVTETAPDFGLAIRRIEPSGADASVVLEDADFAAVLLWIDALERDHGLRVASIEMDRRPEPGVVGARLGLAR